MKFEITPRYGDGFTIMSGDRPLVSWDEPLSSLLQRNEVEVLTAGNGRSYVFIAHPIQVGRLLITNGMCSNYLPLQQAPYHHRLDVPAEEFHAEIRAENRGTSHYEYLHQLLRMDLGDPSYTYYSSHGKYTDFTFFTAGMFITIASHYSPGHLETASIRIRNQREYRQLLIDGKMTTSLCRARVWSLDIKELNMPGEYKKFDYIKGRPRACTEKYGESPLIWLDEDANIGFSAGLFAQLLAIADVRGLYIERYEPARGPGYSELYIEPKDADCPRRLVFHHQSWTAFDDHIQPIRDFTGLSVETRTFADV